ncbi:hypothetical protein [Sphingomonas colocasiae]|uniref:Insulinase family protein n=1 Tax=Sphingomonas colocasiae TaxID=1848973 RepID=A0ABS7PPS4_9SPHN|nr:hypothetical protein [Sphingomonas colocasiae]MBY8823331.1 hypothetical protein [Sphingomonas colocasiae]MBY8826466.1 hypothetical protein [Sphingomonas colocasiae]
MKFRTYSKKVTAMIYSKARPLLVVGVAGALGGLAAFGYARVPQDHVSASAHGGGGHATPAALATSPSVRGPRSLSGRSPVAAQSTGKVARAAVDARTTVSGTLPNGFRYHIIGLPDTFEMTSARLMLRVGMVDEKEGQQQIGHLIEHLVLTYYTDGKGKRKLLGDLRESWMPRAYAVSAGGVNWTDTRYHLEAPNGEVDALFERVREIAQGSRFTADEVKIQRRPVELEFSASPYLDGFQHRSWRMLNAMAGMADHSVNRWKKASEKFPFDQVRAFADEYYVPEREMLYVATSLDPLLIKAMIEKKFGNMKRGRTNVAALSGACIIRPDPQISRDRRPVRLFVAPEGKDVRMVVGVGDSGNIKLKSGVEIAPESAWSMVMGALEKMGYGRQLAMFRQGVVWRMGAPLQIYRVAQAGRIASLVGSDLAELKGLLLEIEKNSSVVASNIPRREKRNERPNSAENYIDQAIARDCDNPFQRDIRDLDNDEKAEYLKAFATAALDGKLQYIVSSDAGQGEEAVRRILPADTLRELPSSSDAARVSDAGLPDRELKYEIQLARGPVSAAQRMVADALLSLPDSVPAAAMGKEEYTQEKSRKGVVESITESAAGMRWTLSGRASAEPLMQEIYEDRKALFAGNYSADDVAAVADNQSLEWLGGLAVAIVEKRKIPAVFQPVSKESLLELTSLAQPASLVESDLSPGTHYIGTSKSRFAQIMMFLRLPEDGTWKNLTTRDAIRIVRDKAGFAYTVVAGDVKVLGGVKYQLIQFVTLREDAQSAIEWVEGNVKNMNKDVRLYSFVG